MHQTHMTTTTITISTPVLVLLAATGEWRARSHGDDWWLVVMLQVQMQCCWGALLTSCLTLYKLMSRNLRIKARCMCVQTLELEQWNAKRNMQEQEGEERGVMIQFLRTSVMALASCLVECC